MTKTIFIISSGEGKKYAQALKNLLNNSFASSEPRYSVEVWSDEGQFPLTHTTIESLEKKILSLAENKGFIVAMMTPDDPVNIKDKSVYIPRDNVIFELGMAFGRLGRHRSIIIKPKISNFHMLTDIDGVTYGTYGYLTSEDTDGLTPNQADNVINSALADAVDTIFKYISNFTFS